jgi:hypothetical protein
MDSTVEGPNPKPKLKKLPVPVVGPPHPGCRLGPGQQAGGSVPDIPHNLKALGASGVLQGLG